MFSSKGLQVYSEYRGKVHQYLGQRGWTVVDNIIIQQIFTLSSPEENAIKPHQCQFSHLVIWLTMNSGLWEEGIVCKVQRKALRGVESFLNSSPHRNKSSPWVEGTSSTMVLGWEGINQWNSHSQLTELWEKSVGCCNQVRFWIFFFNVAQLYQKLPG